MLSQTEFKPTQFSHVNKVDSVKKSYWPQLSSHDSQKTNKFYVKLFPHNSSQGQLIHGQNFSNEFRA